MVDTPAFLQRVYSHRSLSFCTCLLLFFRRLCCTYPRFALREGLIFPPDCCNGYSEICIGSRLTGSCLLGQREAVVYFSFISLSHSVGTNISVDFSFYRTDIYQAMAWCCREAIHGVRECMGGKRKGARD